MVSSFRFVIRKEEPCGRCLFGFVGSDIEQQQPNVEGCDREPAMCVKVCLVNLEHQGTEDVSRSFAALFHCLLPPRPLVDFRDGWRLDLWFACVGVCGVGEGNVACVFTKQAFLGETFVYTVQKW